MTIRTHANELPGEQVVLVDEDGYPIGVADKAGIHTSATPLHLGFSCYIFDATHRVLLTTRAPGKTFSGVLTNSFCGHPAPGEQLEAAVHRRAYDELGLSIHDVRLVLPDFRYRAEQDGIVENELCPVLTARTGEQPTPCPDEVAAIEWAPWAQVRDDVLAGRRSVSPWFAEQIALLAAYPDDPRAWPVGHRTQLPAALQSQ